MKEWKYYPVNTSLTGYYTFQLPKWAEDTPWRDNVDATSCNSKYYLSKRQKKTIVEREIYLEHHQAACILEKSVSVFHPFEGPFWQIT